MPVLHAVACDRILSDAFDAIYKNIYSYNRSYNHRYKNKNNCYINFNIWSAGSVTVRLCRKKPEARPGSEPTGRWIYIYIFYFLGSLGVEKISVLCYNV